MLRWLRRCCKAVFLRWDRRWRQSGSPACGGRPAACAPHQTCRAGEITRPDCRQQQVVYALHQPAQECSTRRPTPHPAEREAQCKLTTCTGFRTSGYWKPPSAMAASPALSSVYRQAGKLTAGLASGSAVGHHVGCFGQHLHQEMRITCKLRKATAKENVGPGWTWNQTSRKFPVGQSRSITPARGGECIR